MNDLDKSYEEWVEWIESMQEPNGSISLDKNPELLRWIDRNFGHYKKVYVPWSGTGETVSFKRVDND